MKRTRSLNLSGEFERVVHAREVPPAERRQHHFMCLDENCGAQFHLVRRHRRKENTEVEAPTFARNPSSKHREGCKYDFEYIASHHQYQSFVQGDKLHLRINFPLGGCTSDRHPEQGGLSQAQRAAADRNTDKKPVASLQVLARFLEKQFGNLQSDALENLVLDYQGISYAWENVFTDADSYARLYTEAAREENDKKGLLIAVRPSHETSRNRNDKRRFLCEPQNVIIGGRRETIRPVIVCENDAIADQVRLGRTMMVATKPYIPPPVLAQDLPPNT